METLFIPSDRLFALLAKVAEDKTVYYPVQEAEGFHIRRSEGLAPGGFAFNPTRVRQPLKYLFYGLKDRVSRFFSEDAGPAGSDRGERLIVGPKACDLHGLSVLDRVFLEGELKDRVYSENRSHTTVISGDCTDFGEHCFCTTVGNQPYPTEGFDLNLSPVSGGFVAEVGSGKGEAIVEKERDLLQEATRGQLQERDAAREAVLSRAEAASAGSKIAGSLRDLVAGRFEPAVWEKHAERCVECASCTFVCDGCYCFMLYDKKADDGYDRLRVLDSCQYKEFARVAGGANPRKRIAERMRHRFFHKFVQFPENYGIYSCCGCGRCIEGCIANISTKEILEDLASEP